jgi:hypothetical protein
MPISFEHNKYDIWTQSKLDARDFKHAQQMDQLAQDAQTALDLLTRQHDASVSAITQEAAEQAGKAAQQHAREKKHLMTRLMDAAYAQQENTHRSAKSSILGHQQATACVRLGAMVDRWRLQQLIRGFKQWFVTTQSSSWVRTGRCLAGAWFLKRARATRSLKDVFRAWKAYTDFSALGHDKLPLNPAAPQAPASSGKLLRCLGQNFADGSRGRLVRLSGGAPGHSSGQAAHKLLVGMVFGGLAVHQIQTLQPSLLEAVYGSRDMPDANSYNNSKMRQQASEGVACGHSIGSGDADSTASSASPLELYALAKNRPWRVHASWGGAGASLAAEGRERHDKEWQRNRRRLREALTRRYGAERDQPGIEANGSQQSVTRDSHSIASAVGGALQSQQHRVALPLSAGTVAVLGAGQATQKQYYPQNLNNPYTRRLGLQVRGGEHVVVLFTEAARIVAVCKLGGLLHRLALRQRSAAWRQWVAAVNYAGIHSEPLGLTASNVAPSHVHHQLAEIRAQLDAAHLQRDAAQEKAAAAADSMQQLEEAATDSLLQLAESQQALAEAQAAQDLLKRMLAEAQTAREEEAERAAQHSGESGSLQRDPASSSADTEAAQVLRVPTAHVTQPLPSPQLPPPRVPPPLQLPTQKKRRATLTPPSIGSSKPHPFTTLPVGGSRRHSSATGLQAGLGAGALLSNLDGAKRLSVSTLRSEGSVHHQQLPPHLGAAAAGSQQRRRSFSAMLQHVQRNSTPQ